MEDLDRTKQHIFVVKKDVRHGGPVTADGWYTEHEPTFTVWLPHQCDEWMITERFTKQAAITDLENFIAKAQNALAKLKAMET